MWKDPDGNPLQGTMLSTRGHNGAREISTSATCDNLNERHAKLEAEIIVLKQENYKVIHVGNRLSCQSCPNFFP
jgi:hypothetical protein